MNHAEKDAKPFARSCRGFTNEGNRKGRMESRYISGKELMEMGVCTYRELCHKCEQGEIQAYTSDGGRVVNTEIMGENEVEKEGMEDDKIKGIVDKSFENEDFVKKYCEYFKKIFDKNYPLPVIKQIAQIGIKLVSNNLSYGDTLFPFNEAIAIFHWDYTEEKMKAEVEAFLFLRTDVEKVFYQSAASSRENLGLYSLVTDMLKSGRTKSEIAKALQEKGLSLSIIGALLFDGGLNKEGGFATPKQCSDFYQKKAQALLRGGGEDSA